MNPVDKHGYQNVWKNSHNINCKNTIYYLSWTVKRVLYVKHIFNDDNNDVLTFTRICSKYV